MRDRIDDLVVSYPSCRRLICEYVIQWLPTVASQCQAIQEAIETDYPCSDDFMEEIVREQGLPLTVSDRSSSSTRSQVDPASPDADKALGENANRIPEPFPTPSSSMREQGLEDYQGRGQECEGSNRSQVPREPPCSQPPSDDHGVKGNPSKVDVLAAESVCTPESICTLWSVCALWSVCTLGSTCTLGSVCTLGSACTLESVRTLESIGTLGSVRTLCPKYSILQV